MWPQNTNTKLNKEGGCKEQSIESHRPELKFLLTSVNLGKSLSLWSGLQWKKLRWRRGGEAAKGGERISAPLGG